MLQRARGTRALAQRHAVVVRHLLEVWNQPLRVHGVTMEAATELIVNTAADHATESVVDDAAGPFRAALGIFVEEQIECSRVRKLRRAAEAAVPEIERMRQLFERVGDELSRQLAGPDFRAGGGLEPLADLRRCGARALLFLVPDTRDLAQHARK